MKRFALLAASFVFAISLTACTPQTVDSDELELIDGLGILIATKEPFTGFSENRYESQRLYVRAEFKDGLEHGMTTYWHENGVKMREEFYEEGRNVGTWVHWDAEGNKTRETQFDGGFLTGTEIIYYEDGTQRSKSHYDKGVREGMQTLWYENGQKEREVMYKGNKRVGEGIWWDREGNEVRRVDFGDGDGESGLVPRINEVVDGVTGEVSP